MTTIKNESIHFMLVEDSTTEASRLSLESLESSFASVKVAKVHTTVKAVEVDVTSSLHFYRTEKVRMDRTLEASLFDDPESFEIW